MPMMRALLVSVVLAAAAPDLGRFGPEYALEDFVARGGEAFVWRATVVAIVALCGRSRRCWLSAAKHFRQTPLRPEAAHSQRIHAHAAVVLTIVAVQTPCSCA